MLCQGLFWGIAGSVSGSVFYSLFIALISYIEDLLVKPPAGPIVTPIGVFLFSLVYTNFFTLVPGAVGGVFLAICLYYLLPKVRYPILFGVPLGSLIGGVAGVISSALLVLAFARDRTKTLDLFGNAWDDLWAFVIPAWVIAIIVGGLVGWRLASDCE